MIRRKSTLSLLALSLGLAFAQQAQAASPSGAQKDAMARISYAANGNAQFSYHEATGGASFISARKGYALSSGTANTAADQKAHSLQFFKDNAALFGIRDAATELSDPIIVKDNTGATHLNYTQIYQGLPVYGGELKSHYDKSGALSAVNGRFVADISVNTSPARTADEASKQALALVSKRFAKSSGLTASQPMLMIFRKGLLEQKPGWNYLAWMVEVGNQKDVREFVYLDANSNKLLAQYTGIFHAMNRRIFDAENTGVAGPNYPKKPIWLEGDAFPSGIQQVDNLLAAAKDIYGMMFKAFGRDSYDGNGARMDAIFNAAFPTPRIEWLGNFLSVSPGLTTDDLIAHEWGHAYSQSTAHFGSEGHAGALNESYSDIWGETLDQLNGRGLDTPNAKRSNGACTTFTKVGAGTGTDNSLLWLLGEEQTAINDGGALRDMYNPSCYGHSGKVTDPGYSCEGDPYDLAGIPNHAYALLVDGGSYNEQNITGLGLTKAAHIWWRALSVYDTSTTNFSEQADALETSCADLTGVNLKSLVTGEASGEIITTDDCAQVAKANLAVAFRAPSGCFEFGRGPLLQKNPPPLCASGTASALLADNFEGGKRGGLRWLVSHQGNTTGYLANDFGVVTNLPDGRPGYALFAKSPNTSCEQNRAGVARLESPTFVIPAGEKNPMLTFDHWMLTEPGYDGGNIKVQINGAGWQVLARSDFIYNPYNTSFIPSDRNANPLASEWAFTGGDDFAKSGSWGRSIVKLSRLARPGDTVKLRFELGVDGCNGTDRGWYIDDVMVYQCKP